MVFPDSATLRAPAVALALVFLLGVACGRDDQVLPDSGPLQAVAEDDGRAEPDSQVRGPSGEAKRRQAVSDTPPVTAFSNVAEEVLGPGYEVWNDRPGVVVFDYDRDGDPDLYITQKGGFPNHLYRNDGLGGFVDVAEEAGVTATESHSTGAMACDLNNDGYQDLYVGAWGDPEDKLDFRSPSEGQGNKDHLYLNNGDGTFRDITDAAFGDAVNLRSATSIACADVDNDGWLDIYVGNLGAHDFRDFGSAHHPGHYNVLYRNNGDLTFEDVSEQAGVRGDQILMRDPSGEPVLFEDPETGEMYEGWDPTRVDRLGNQVGEPTAQTHAMLFFDHDDDGDLDLWLADDGDTLKVLRNDTTPGNIAFTSIEREMGIDLVGAWMGFAVGDYDGDADLDVFVTNIGYHTVLRSPPPNPTGSCTYHHRFAWGTCLHFLLRNDGTEEAPIVGTIGRFPEVTGSTTVVPSPYMPPESLDPTKIHPAQEQPSGLAAYDFGFGTTFFDYDNDGDQDLYWLGSNKNSGAGPGGDVYPSAGRMLRGDGKGTFEDVTVQARLLDIARVDYSNLEGASDFSATAQRISNRFHENGKGLAHGDLNGDGYLDLVGTNSSGMAWGTGDQTSLIAVPGPVFVWLNGGGDNHWISLRLQGRMAVDGTGSNADGIGARVFLKSVPVSGADPLVQVQEVRAGSSYLSMDSIELEFGLGQATTVDEITIVWPSGRRQVLEDLAADRVVLVTEPEL